MYKSLKKILNSINSRYSELVTTSDQKSTINTKEILRGVKFDTRQTAKSFSKYVENEKENKKKTKYYLPSTIETIEDRIRRKEKKKQKRNNRKLRLYKKKYIDLLVKIIKDKNTNIVLDGKNSNQFILKVKIEDSLVTILYVKEKQQWRSPNYGDPYGIGSYHTVNASFGFQNIENDDIYFTLSSEENKIILKNITKRKKLNIYNLFQISHIDPGRMNLNQQVSNFQH